MSPTIFWTFPSLYMKGIMNKTKIKIIFKIWQICWYFLKNFFLFTIIHYCCNRSWFYKTNNFFLKNVKIIFNYFFQIYDKKDPIKTCIQVAEDVQKCKGPRTDRKNPPGVLFSVYKYIENISLNEKIKYFLKYFLNIFKYCRKQLFLKVFILFYFWKFYIVFSLVISI